MTNDLIAKAAIDRRMAEIITPVIEDMGFELVRVRLMSGKSTTLQIMADKPDGGIEVDDCAEISREVRDWLDETGAAGESYILEVSSPGVERPLVRQDDYKRFAGFEVRLRGFGPLADGERQVEGILRGVVEEGDAGPVVVLERKDGEMRVPVAGIAKANLVYRPESDL